ncbi:MAG TPA: hypothetical protein VFB80_10030, partial [Pirellulaceae bacterium]|nr:hypothetical protein [Pirellulaceae bacterium]
DASRIARAADERMALVRSYQVGPRGAYTQRLLNELSAARICLLTPASKAQYDAALGQRMRAEPQADAPPRLPPPAPPPTESTALPSAAADDASATPHGWPRLVAAMLAVAALVLCAIGGGIWIRSYWPPARPVEPPRPVVTEPAPPQPIIVLQEGSGEVVLSAATATLAGAVELQVVGTEEVLAHWTTPEDRAVWHFRLVKPGPFYAELTCATSAEAEGFELELVVDDRATAHLLGPSGGFDQFRTDKVPLVIASGGEHTLTLRLAKAPPADWLVLKSVRLVPVSADAPPDAPAEAPAPSAP